VQASTKATSNQPHKHSFVQQPTNRLPPLPIQLKQHLRRCRSDASTPAVTDQSSTAPLSNKASTFLFCLAFGRKEDLFDKKRRIQIVTFIWTYFVLVYLFVWPEHHCLYLSVSSSAPLSITRFRRVYLPARESPLALKSLVISLLPKRESRVLERWISWQQLGARRLPPELAAGSLPPPPLYI
jgi:hypothetical protein